jgi:hypothetical protein
MMQVAHPFAGIVPNDREVPAPVAVRPFFKFKFIMDLGTIKDLETDVNKSRDIDGRDA